MGMGFGQFFNWSMTERLGLFDEHLRWPDWWWALPQYRGSRNFALVVESRHLDQETHLMGAC